MRVTPDDTVYDVRAVWLGPKGLSFPWVARYIAYAVWLALFLLILLIEAITPLSVGLPPVWEAAIAVFITYAVMGFVDNERPVKSLWQMLRWEWQAPRPRREAKRITVDRSLKLERRS